VPPLLLDLPGDNTYANYAEANRTLWRQAVIPLSCRLAKSLSRWLFVGDDATFELRPDLDNLDAQGLTPPLRRLNASAPTSTTSTRSAPTARPNDGEAWVKA
jgi:phage portal protein BeeE